MEVTCDSVLVTWHPQTFDSLSDFFQDNLICLSEVSGLQTAGNTLFLKGSHGYIKVPRAVLSPNYGRHSYIYEIPVQQHEPGDPWTK